eukprot:TRINITY_DN4190_c0_g1_i3.p1 TRINITY_DN4190_c0_g1~~TRINITY_DN4190_c0_g1_i3.p1  ORF type:complete len:289 (+),score=26.30 TRINITY_DN4190_c0_g1_i3:52-918(+)
MLIFVIISVICVSVSGQQYPQQVCDEGDVATLGQILKENITESDVSELEPLIKTAEDIFNSSFVGLTIEESTEKLPEIYNQTIMALISEFSDTPNDGLYQTAFVEGLLQSENGSQILIESISAPQIFGETVFVIFSGLNLSCFRTDGLDITSIASTLTKPLFTSSYLDRLADSLAWLVVDWAEMNGLGTQVVQLLVPLIDSLEQTHDTQEVMVELQNLSASKLVADAAQDVMKSVGFEITTGAWQKSMVPMYFEQIQQIMKLNVDTDFVELLLKTIDKIIIEIELGYI